MKQIGDFRNVYLFLGSVFSVRFLFYFTFGHLFNGFKKMLDFVTNRSCHQYTNFAPSANNHDNTLASLTSLKRFSQDQRTVKQRARKVDLEVKDKQLFGVKEIIPEAHITEKRPFMGYCCQSCTATSRGEDPYHEVCGKESPYLHKIFNFSIIAQHVSESLVKKTSESLALINILNYQRPSNKQGILYRAFAHLHQASQLKTFAYPQISDLVLKDDRVKSGIEKAALQQFKDSVSSDDDFYQKLVLANQRRAKRLIADMSSSLSDFLLRFTSWILYKLLPCFMSSIVVHPGQVEMIKEASKSNLPLIFLPLHRSHLDYMLVTFILLNNNIRSPLVAAGDNLRIPFFGSVLRGLGAFYIKRRIDPVMGRKDYVYKAILHTYINLGLRAGHNLEFFLEGGRTRTGKPLMPKYGILSVIVDTFMDGTIEDALLVPVSVNYEKLVDGNFVQEQLGQPKKMESFGGALKSFWNILNSNYGQMRIDFNQPFSLSELIKSFDNTKMIPSPSNRVLKSNPSTNSLYGTDVVSEEHKNLVEKISKHVIYDCGQSSCIMSTNALAFLLLTNFREGASLETLVGALEQLKRDLNNASRGIGFYGDSVDVINYAVDLLGPALIRKEKQNGVEIFKPVVILPNVIELSYYSNTLVAHYALESVVAIALTVSEIRLNTVSHEDLMENALELCSVLQYEFLFCKPCENLESVISDCIENLIFHKEIFLSEKEDNEIIKKSRRIAARLEEEFDDEPAVFQKLYKLNPEALDKIKQLVCVLMPLVETYAVTGFVLDKLVQRQLLENELVDDVLHEMRSQLERKSLQYEEAVAVDPIKNALKFYQKLRILECHQEGKLRLYYLNESYDNSESVDEFYQKVNKFRTGNLLIQ